MLRRLTCTLALLGLGLARGAVPRDPPPSHSFLRNDALELRFDPTTGQLSSVIHRPSGLRLAGAGGSSIDIRTDAGWRGGPWRLVGQRIDGGRLWVRSRAGDWELTTHYELDARAPFLARRGVFRYVGKGTPTVRGTRFVLGGAACGGAAESTYEILSRWPPERFGMAALVDGRRRQGTSSAATSRFVAIHNRSRKLSLISAFYSESETASLAVRERPKAIDVEHHHHVLDRPTQGREIPTGTQYLFVANGDWQDALRACQGFYDHIGVRVPPEIAERGARSLVYSCHPGGTIDSGFRDVGHIRNLQRGLPHLERLGVNTVWLLPFWRGRVYAPLDYASLQANWADEASLRAFVDDAHRRKMRVLLDLIPHGPQPESGLHEAHRDWVSTTEDGRLLLWWGCLGCDYAHPGWQGFMADHAADWVRRAGIDGYRVDCAGGGPPNWAAAEGRRPSQSGLWGALGILRKSRAAMEAVKKPIILLPEAEGVPLNTVGEFTYPWTWFFHVLPALRRMPAEEWVPKAMHWLQNHQMALPRGANHVWFLENHDTLRAELVWGPDAHRALLALCAFLPGAPFLYHEQEVGYGFHLRRLYAIRRASDVLSVGAADFSPLADDPRVFTITRRLGNRFAVIAVSFADKPVTMKLRFPDDAPKRLRVLTPRHGITMRPDESLRLEPWAYAVVTAEAIEASGPPLTFRRPWPRPRQREGDDSILGMRPEMEHHIDDDIISLRGRNVSLVLDRRAGGLIRSLGGGPRSLVAGHEFREGPRKLWPGRPAFRLSATEKTNQDMVVVMEGDSGSAHLRRQLTDDLAASISYWADRNGRLSHRVTIEPAVNIDRTRARVTTTLRFPRADAWAVRTAEGLLADAHVVRRPDGKPYTGRYWHPTTSHYWESRLQPLHPDRGGRPAIFLVDRAGGGHVGVTVSASHPDLLQNIVLAPRDGEHEQLTLRIEWLRGDRPVSLTRGETYGLSFSLVPGGGSLPLLPPQPDPKAKPPTPALRAAMGDYEVSNRHYRLVLGRSSGGNIRRLELKGSAAALIDHSRIYTDYGLYDTYRDPLGREHPVHAHNENDVEPDVELRRDGTRLIIGFTSYFRHPGYQGRSLLSPRMQYRLRYVFDDSPTIQVEAAVRPQITLREAKAFLAHTLRLPAASRWAVAGPDGGFTGPLAQARGRLWQSATRPLREPRLTFETPGGCIRLGQTDPPDAHQNLFLHPGPGATTVFMAFLDGQPAEVTPHWRTLRYTLTVAPGKLDPALQQLAPWPPGDRK